jgi:cytochrome c oxidase subunit 2
MRRHMWIVAISIVLIAVAAEALVLNARLYPAVAATEEAVHLDEAFRRLVVLAVPVFTFVVVVLGYSIWRFRADSDAVQDGPAIHGHQLFSVAWLIVTTVLAGILFYNPGLTSWFYLQADASADMVVEVEAAQWHWHVTYPEYDLSVKSSPTGWELMANNAVLALPAGRRVKFEITSADVIHSFWIPAFRMKVDAVPGKTTTMYVTPSRTGTFADDINYRVQCAEMCGTGHPRMNMQVAVMEETAFEEWAAQQSMGMETMDMGGTDMEGAGGMDMGGAATDQHTEGDNH